VQKEEQEKNKEIKTKLWVLYLKNGWNDLFQILYVHAPTWWASLQQIWFNLGKRSWSYIGVKISFSFFLSIYSQYGAPTSWAADTQMCEPFTL